MSETTKFETVKMKIESPTWGQIQRMAEEIDAVLQRAGGSGKALSYESFYTLVLLANLKLDEEKSGAHIFGRQWIE